MRGIGVWYAIWLMVQVGIFGQQASETLTNAQPGLTARGQTSCTCEPVININTPPIVPSSCDCKNLTKWLSTTETGLNGTKADVEELSKGFATIKGSVDELKEDINNTHNEVNFYNYYDEIAQGACVGMNTAGGWTYAVRRDCRRTRTCATICQDPRLKIQDPEISMRRMTCFNALHIEPTRPRFPVGAGIEKLGLKTYRYNDCNWNTCGPNYCCCRTP